jgi:type II secretory pathway component HofQ
MQKLVPGVLLLCLAAMLGSPAVSDEEPRQDEQAGESRAEEKKEAEGEETSWQGERISLSLREADLRDVLLSFAELAEVNMVIDPDVQGTVTVELKDVPWDQALSVILKSHGLGMEISRSDPSLWAISSRR